MPRGRQQLEKNPEFFRSVHLVGEGLAKEKEEAKRKSEEIWRSKVIRVDSDETFFSGIRKCQHAQTRWSFSSARDALGED